MKNNIENNTDELNLSTENDNTNNNDSNTITNNDTHLNQEGTPALTEDETKTPDDLSSIHGMVTKSKRNFIFLNTMILLLGILIGLIIAKTVLINNNYDNLLENHQDVNNINFEDINYNEYNLNKISNNIINATNVFIKNSDIANRTDIEDAYGVEYLDNGGTIFTINKEDSVKIEIYNKNNELEFETSINDKDTYISTAITLSNKDVMLLVNKEINSKKTESSLIKYNSNGDIISEHKVSSNDKYVYGLIPTENSDAFLLLSYSSSGSDLNPKFKSFITKYDKDLNEEFTFESNKNHQISKIITDKDSIFIVTSSYDANPSSSITILNNKGEVLNHIESVGEYTIGSAIKVNDGYICLTEKYLNEDTYYSYPPYSIVKMDLNGNVIWENKLDSTSVEYKAPIIDTKDGFIAITEDMHHSNIDDSAIALISFSKYDLDGNIVWTKYLYNNKDNFFINRHYIDEEHLVLYSEYFNNNEVVEDATFKININTGEPIKNN